MQKNERPALFGSDEGITFETSASSSLHGGKFDPYQPI